MPTNIPRIIISRMIFCAVFAAYFLSGSPIEAKPLASPSASPARSLGSSSRITPEEALQIVARKLGRSKVKNTHLAVDHTEDRDGRSYHVIHGYDVVVDDEKTGEGHTATWGWFFVDQKSGAAYKWDIAEDKLIPF